MLVVPHKIINLSGVKINDTLLGKHFFLSFLPETPSFLFHTHEGLFELTWRPSRALDLLRMLLLELQRNKDTVRSHMMTASFLVFTFIKKGLKTTKVKSTSCASKKIKTYHHRAFCATHWLLSHPQLMCGHYFCHISIQFFAFVILYQPVGEIDWRSTASDAIIWGGGKMTQSFSVRTML